MLDKIVISKDRKTATVVTDTKTYSLYDSSGNVEKLVEEMVTAPVERRERCEEVTEKLDLQMSFDLEVAS